MNKQLLEDLLWWRDLFVKEDDDFWTRIVDPYRKPRKVLVYFDASGRGMGGHAYELGGEDGKEIVSAETWNIEYDKIPPEWGEIAAAEAVAGYISAKLFMSEDRELLLLGDNVVSQSAAIRGGSRTVNDVTANTINAVTGELWSETARRRSFWWAERVMSHHNASDKVSRGLGPLLFAGCPEYVDRSIESEAVLTELSQKIGREAQFKSRLERWASECNF